jgi:gamma-glutamylaminecyclotransferase
MAENNTACQGVFQANRDIFMPMQSNLIFVFGTLKEGFPNFGANSGIRVPGTYVTTLAFPFFLVGERSSPWMMDSPGRGHRVAGQLFDVDEAGLRSMDLLERVSEPDGYVRRQISVRRKGDLQDIEVIAFAYLKAPQLLDEKEVRLGPLEEYTLEHSALYRPRTSL